VSYQSPGVYIEEVPSGPQPIAAASTSVAAVLGTTRKGPVLSPTRVTSWSDYVRVFGPATSRGVTAESVFGFFENGGPAAWIVRVDPSTAAEWTVRDGQAAPATSFVATAASPGAWANGPSLHLSPDVSGGLGTLARATVTGPVTAAVGTASVPVAASGGLAIGDTVLLTNRTETSAATVTSVAASAIGVNNTGSSITLAAGDAVVLTTTAAPASLVFAAGSGVRAHDLLVIQRPDGSQVSVLVASVTQDGPTMTVALAAPLGAAVTAGGFARRRTTFSGRTTGNTGGTLPMSKIQWDVGDAGPRHADNQLDNARVTLPGGGIATWNGTTFVVAGGGDVAAGPITAEAQVRVAVFTAAISFTPTDVAEVLARYSYLPVGTTMSLTDGTATTTVARTGAGSTNADGTQGGDAFGPTYTTATFVLPTDASRGVVVRCPVAPEVGDFVAFSGAKTFRITAATPVDGDIYVLDFAEAITLVNETGGDSGRFALIGVAPTTAFPARFTLTVEDDGATVETFSGLALHPSHARYYAKDGVVNGISGYVRLADRAAGAPAIALATMPAAVTRTQDGVDQPATNQHYVSALEKLETVDEPAMVIAPDSVRVGDPLLQADLIGKVVRHCEQFRRFAIIDGPDLSTVADFQRDKALLDWRNATLSSTYAAIYAPFLKIVTIDPDAPDRFTMVPPSGFVAGVFARTDRERGVHKAPGNERVNGIVGLAEQYSQRRQDLLNPNAVNLIRSFPGRGTRIWGARNATDDVTWRYVNVRRLFSMIETSVERSTQWVVFEPNTPTTWIRIKVSVENFLDQQWRAGALAGTRPEEAYRVRVGLGETMTETDIDVGLVITEVAIAPAKPAEFVVFRFSHKRLSE
jgi:phage tail sheath protein FI